MKLDMILMITAKNPTNITNIIKGFCVPVVAYGEENPIPPLKIAMIK